MQRELLLTIHLVLVVLIRLVLGPVTDHLLDSSVLPPYLQHGLVYLLIDPGHSYEPCWSHLIQSVDQRTLQCCLVCEPYCGSSEEAEIDINDLGSNVTERKVGDTVLSINGPVKYLLTNLTM